MNELHDLAEKKGLKTLAQTIDSLLSVSSPSAETVIHSACEYLEEDDLRPPSMASTTPTIEEVPNDPTPELTTMERAREKIHQLGLEYYDNVGFRLYI